MKEVSLKARHATYFCNGMLYAESIQYYTSPLEFGGLGWGSQNVEAPNPKLPTKWFLNVFLMKNI